MTVEAGRALGEVLAGAGYGEENVRELVRLGGLDPARGAAALRAVVRRVHRPEITRMRSARRR